MTNATKTIISLAYVALCGVMIFSGVLQTPPGERPHEKTIYKELHLKN